MTFKMKRVALAAASISALALSSSVMAKDFGDEMIIVHPFQWPYKLIAEECEKNWGPAGMDGVQISQPAKHIGRNDVWWAVYQPLKWNDHNTMTGSAQELKDMIQRCDKVGVKIFADAVFNQRGDESLNDGDYHNNGCTINNYGDANHVRTCALSGMRDVATDNPSTQDKIVDLYLKPLVDMGVYGFRIDAAKHMGYTDLASIANKLKSKVGKTVPMYYEVIGSQDEAADIQPDKYQNNPGNVVTDFTYVWKIADAYHWKKDYKLALEITSGDGLSSETSQVFVNNHDDEWGRCSAGTCSMPTQDYPNYHLAQSWMIVWPHGKVRQVYSGYRFDVHDPNSGNPKRISDYTHDVGGPLGDGLCQGGWKCQHRVPWVLNATRFARATRGTAVSTKGFDNGILWFNRGSKGFYAQNTSDSSVTKEFSVNVPDGTYCDILGQEDPCGGAQITVSGGKAKFTIKGKAAAAICVGEYCGKSVDPCELDSTSAQCICKDQSDKNTCNAYCETTGKNTSACICKGEETNSAGICVSYCEANPTTDGCFCILNPDEEGCQQRYTPSKGKLCYAGTSNSWEHSPMTYSAATDKWSINLDLSGKGDASGDQRFKITDGCAWTDGKVYGKGDSADTLALNDKADGDVKISQTGKYTLYVHDKTLKFELIETAAQNNDPVASFTKSVKGLTVSFTNNSSDKDGDALTYSWDFGNGKTSTEKSPSVTYDKAGTYTVKLVVKDAKGASNSKTESVTVRDGSTDTGYKKVAIRASEDNYGTNEFTKKSEGVWELLNFAFTKNENNFKIEALADSQCVIIGGTLGKALSAAGDFIAIDKGTYDIVYNEKTNIVTATLTGTCVGDLCGTKCNKGADCVDGICQGTDCAYEEVCKGPKCGTQCNSGKDCVDGVCQGTDCEFIEISDTKVNCEIDGTTNNCEDSQYAYDFLGAQYTKDATTFRIWSPDSSNVTVDVNGQTHKLTKTSVNGYSDVYEVKVTGDLDQKTYQFKINGNAVRDPYGKMVVPTTYSGSDGVGVVASDNRNVVMNMRKTDLPQGWAKRPTLVNREDAIIYEVHVRDFTVDRSSGVSDANRGRYLGMVETGTKSPEGLKTGIDHLKELGVTHVQLLPIYDFGTCSDVDSQNDSCYNWGYDPVNFNVPEDRYSSAFKTENYNQKVKEFKEMVDEFHKHGFRVIMDVVYNHTYNKEMFEKITGKYYTSGDLSGCGNSTDSKNDMVSRFIRDSLEYWLTEYNVDGFRFDLVGIFDIQDFKEWGEYLNNKYPERNLLMYGEPWNGYATDPSEGTRVRMGTIRQGVSGHVGVFNGKFRECVKGGSDNNVGGFMFNMTYHDLGAGVSNNVECVSAGVKGAIGDNTNMWTPLFAADPEQSINYLTAHDNLTLADKITKMKISGEYASRLQAYGNGIMLVSQGIPFIHAGAEFSRSKNGDHNSYKTPGDVNNIKWGLKKTNQAVFDYYKGMIAMRNAHPAFRMPTRNLIENNVTTYGKDGAIVVDINGAAAGDSWKNIKMVINSGNNMTIDGVDGWKKKVHGVTVNNDGTSGNNTAEGTAVTIWYKE